MSQFQENSYSKTTISFKDKCYSDASLTKTANKGTEVIVLEYLVVITTRFDVGRVNFEELLCNCSSINFKDTRKKIRTQSP